MGVLNTAGSWLGLARGMLGQALGLPSPWEHSIRAFEARDRRHAPGQGSIVFVGSSSFTLWSSLEADMAPLPAVNRGFGGALIDDVVRYADRIVVPYQPSAVVLFAGTNDIAGPGRRRPATLLSVSTRSWPRSVSPSRRRSSSTSRLRRRERAGVCGPSRWKPTASSKRESGPTRGFASLTSARSSWAVTACLIPSSTAAMACTRAKAAIASGRERSLLRFITRLR